MTGESVCHRRRRVVEVNSACIPPVTRSFPGRITAARSIGEGKVANKCWIPSRLLEVAAGAARQPGICRACHRRNAREWKRTLPITPSEVALLEGWRYPREVFSSQAQGPSSGLTCAIARRKQKAVINARVFVLGISSSPTSNPARTREDDQADRRNNVSLGIRNYGHACTRTFRKYSQFEAIVEMSRRDVDIRRSVN